MADEALTMPPAGLTDDTDEQRRLQLAGRLRPDLAMPPAGPFGQPPATPTATMPPARVGAPRPAPPVSTASVMPPAAIAATPSPGSLQPESSPTPRANLMPPAEVPIAETPAPGSLQPESSSNGPAGFMPPAHVDVPKPQFGNMNAPTPQPPELHGWRKYVDAIGSMFPIGRAIETAIPGTPRNWEEKQAQQAARTEGQQRIAKGQQELEAGANKAAFDTPEKRRAYMQEHPDEFKGISDFEKNDFVLQGKFPQAEGTLTGKTPEERTLHDLMTGDNGNARINPDTNKPYTYLEAYRATQDIARKPTAFEHATIADPKNPQQGRDVLFDRTSGKYLDPDTRQVIPECPTLPRSGLRRSRWGTNSIRMKTNGRMPRRVKPTKLPFLVFQMQRKKHARNSIRITNRRAKKAEQAVRRPIPTPKCRLRWRRILDRRPRRLSLPTKRKATANDNARRSTGCVRSRRLPSAIRFFAGRDSVRSR
ncbi:MAG: hypothetical protein DMG32_18970 [Acidobacteria bacterium]|nr:MAG: hypothetical protein DMG32_18970 [Acidobacteriota bacterium]